MTQHSPRPIDPPALYLFSADKLIVLIHIVADLVFRVKETYKLLFFNYLYHPVSHCDRFQEMLVI